MKFSSLALVLAASAFSAFSAAAQEPVSTGVISGVTANTGVMTIRSDQTQKPLNFYGLNDANIFTADGRPLTMRDLQPGQRVTVQFETRGNRWMISKVMLAAAVAESAAARKEGVVNAERSVEGAEGTTRTPSVGTPDAIPGANRPLAPQVPATGPNTNGAPR